MEFVYYFAFYSFFGWVLETVYISLKEKKFANRGFLNGPFLPIYGFGTISMILFHEFVTSAPLLLFLFGFIFLSAMEYATSFFMENAFGAKWWTHKDEPLNLSGRIALIPSLYWGTMSTLVTIFFQPYIESFVSGWTDASAAFFGAIIFIVYLMADFIFSFVIARRFCHRVEASLREDITEHMKRLPFSEKRMALASPDFVKGILEKKFTSKVWYN